MIAPPPGHARLVVFSRSRGALPVEASVTTALATLLGAATGGLTSVLATWLMYRTRARAQWLEQEAPRRPDLYMEFIEAAARCYVHALEHEEADISGLVDLDAKINRMRILSSSKIVEIAERFATPFTN